MFFYLDLLFYLCYNYFGDKMKNIFINKRNKIFIIILLVLILIIIPISYIFIYNINNLPSGKENITTKLKSDADFLNWFIDFDNLYYQVVKSPKYSLTKDSFVRITNLLNNEGEENIYYKDNIYYLSDDITIELDVNTRSFRYTKYENNNKIEIFEVRLLNGKYYVQLVNSKYLYKISFNKKKVKNKKYKNEEVIIKDSIFNNQEFSW